jgi:YidC/Oxa1 family membrane protein insertase
MEFDRKTILALALIGLIFIVMQTDYYQENFLPKPPPKQEDTTGTEKEISEPEPMSVLEQPARTEPESALEVSEFAIRGEGEEITIETDLYQAIMSTQGATIRSFKLKNYQIANGSLVELVGNRSGGNLGILLPGRTDTLDTSPLLFEASKVRLNLSNARPRDEIEFVLTFGPNQTLVKKFTFFNDAYSVELAVELKNLSDVVDGYSYLIGWRSGLATTEPNLQMDMEHAKAYASQGDVESFDASDDFKSVDWDHSTDWVGIRTKYFAIVLIPKSGKGERVRFGAEKMPVSEDVFLERYEFDLQMPLKSTKLNQDHFVVYFGPLDYDIVSSYGIDLEKMMDLGWAFFRPFGRIVLATFTWLHGFVPNYGLVIIIFAILVKIVLYPLTHKSYQSIKEMQALQPVIQELNEKYADDPTKKQQEMMKIYQEYGINPLGGCIPMVLQMPLLFALFNVFRSTIELRGADFIWWINDLSMPDTIYTLSFSIPMYGNTVNVLPIFMGVTMFIQQKLTMKDPKQKAMVYFMPIFMTLLFNSFPSGLNLYYALFNLFSIIQEQFMPHKVKTADELKQRAKERREKKRRVPHDYRRRK